MFYNKIFSYREFMSRTSFYRLTVFSTDQVYITHVYNSDIIPKEYIVLYLESHAFFL